MCGILAWFHPPGLNDRGEDIRKATDLMTHRGPDDSGCHVDGMIGLGHRRLSIIDLEGGKQPFSSEDGRYVLVYNGEVYNFETIRRELEGKGHVFRTRSDTEVVLKAYRQWGRACVERFNGMFAFALWDEREERLWVVRDRLGIKPLYFWSDEKSFLCASEIQPILSLGVVKAELDETVLDAYFTLGYVPGPRTMFRGIRKLEPGSFLEVGRDGIRQQSYWDLAEVETGERSDGEAAAELHELLIDCTAKCTVSDVPIGVLLSGGLDSSATVALMREGGIETVNSFTIGYEGPGRENEEEYARQVAARYRCRHFVHVLDSGDFFESLETLVDYTEEPLVEPAAIALFHLAKLAGSEVKVILSGEGSDEIFGGYGIYQKMQKLERIHHLLPRSVWSGLSPLNRIFSSDRLVKYLDWSAEPLEKRFRGTSAVLTHSQKERLYHPEFFSSSDSYLDDVFAGLFARLPESRSALSRILYVDSKTWLPDDLLLKADKMTMAASVELRVPFLDHRLVEFATSLPDDMKIRAGEGKWMLRKVMQNALPEEILHREKMGFPVPTKRWFGGDLFERVREVLIDSTNLPWINSQVLASLFQSGRSLTGEQSRLIMNLLVLDTWRKKHGI